MHLHKKRDEAQPRFRRANGSQWLAALVAVTFPVLVLFSPAQKTVQSAQPPQSLPAQGAPLTRELPGGQAHSYSLALAAGQYLQVSVDQLSCDVAVALRGPDGAMQAEADFDSGLRGQEILAWVAKAACDCKLEVRSKSRTAGRYVLQTAALREATPQDVARVGAYRLQMEARQLRSQATAVAMQQATGKYDEALAAWKNLGDQNGQAATLLELGQLHFDLADAKKSFNAWNEARTLWRALEQRQEEARALSNLALLSYAKGEKEKALEQYKQALAMHRAAGDRFWEAETLNRIGWVYNAMDERQQSIAQYNLALPLRREAGDRQGEAVTLNDLGRASDALGEKQQAIEFYAQALRLSPADENPEGAAQILIRLGVVYDSMGEGQKALDAYGQALSLLETVGNRRALASALNNVGLAHANLGDYGRAIEYYARALKLCRELGLRGGEATTLHNMGLVYRAAGERQKAIDYQTQALAMHKAGNSRSGQSLDLQALGVAYHELGDERRALESFDQTLTLRRALSDRRGEAITLTSMGNAWLALSEPQKAHNYLQQALPLHQAVANPEGEAETLLALARTTFALGDAAAARALLDQSLRLTESIRAKVSSQELRSAYFAAVQRRYELGIDLLMRMQQDQRAKGQEAAALALSERARARSLIELLVESGADIRQGVDVALLAQERALQQRLNARAAAQTRLLGGPHTEAPAASLAQEVSELTAQLQELGTRIRTTSPRYAALITPQPLTTAELQNQLLDNETLLLEYALGEQRSYLWVVTPTTIHSYTLPPRAEIETSARRVYEQFNARPTKAGVAGAPWIAAAAALSRTLLGPAAEQLGKKRLVVVAAGALALLPFAALPDPAVTPTADNYQPLLAAHEVVHLPSASVLAVLRRETAARKPAAQAVAVLADPVFAADDPRVALARNQGTRKTSGPTNPSSVATVASLERAVGAMNLNSERAALARLPFSREEADGILALAPGGRGMKATDFQASRATATSDALKDYRIIHFATHGLLNGECPELSGLVFSLVDESGGAQDGFLRLHEIFNLKLSADLVVLSACQTGLGKQLKGEGLIGLTRGFMYAGAPRVVASLWRVDDLATAELMKRFYRGMLKEGLRPAAALRAAQLELSQQKRWQAPYFWAAFTLQGEWR